MYETYWVTFEEEEQKKVDDIIAALDKAKTDFNVDNLELYNIPDLPASTKIV